MPRPIARGVLSFGLVAIPVELHAAIKSEAVSFHLLHTKCGSRIRNRSFCPVCNLPLERQDLVRGYEFAKGQYVRFTDAELESIEAEANSSIELKEFIPTQAVDPVYFERSYYLAPDKGGEKPYRLLADAMEKAGRGALGEMVSHNKENLVLIRAARGGLILQMMYYANEVRDFGAIGKAEGARLTPEEFELATGLVEKLSSAEFDPEAYTDEYRKRVERMLSEKVKGQDITVAPKAPARGNVVDLYEALKTSLAASKPRKVVERSRKKA